MRSHPAALFAIGGVGIAAVGLFFIVTVQVPPPSPITAPCGPESLGYRYMPVPGGQAISLHHYMAIPSGDRISLWTSTRALNSSWSYSLYLLTQAQYSSFTANGTGPNGTLYYQPP